MFGRRAFLFKSLSPLLLPGWGAGSGCSSNPPRAEAGADGQTEVAMDTQDGAWSVEAEVAGRRLRLLLDTGADHTVLTPQTAAALGLALSDERVPASGGSGSIDPVPWTVIDELAIGTARLRNEQVFVIPVPPEFGYDGVLGGGFFRAFVTRLDAVAGRLRMTLPERFAAAAGSTVLPLRQAGRKLLVPAEAAGVEGWFSIDTGAVNNTLTFFSPTVQRHGLRSRLQPVVRMASGVSVSGVEYADVARAPHLQLGPWQLARPVVELSLASAGLFGSDGWQGNIGNAVWRRFAMTLDVARGQLLLQPQATVGEPFAAPRSGLAARPVGQGLQVIDTVPGGPADEAGVRVGDFIVALDGQALDATRSAALRRAWQQPVGTAVRLQLRDASGVERSGTLVLRELV